MKPSTLPKARPDTMTEAELRYWIEQFLYNPELGWSRCKHAFARYLGTDLSGLKSKIRTTRTQAWFVGGEPRRFSARIRRALAGIVVPVRTRTPAGRWRWDATMTDNPVPPLQPRRMRFNLKTRRLELVPPTRPDFDPWLPSFGKGLARFLGRDRAIDGPTETPGTHRRS
jgi:hypothetical protein